MFFKRLYLFLICFLLISCAHHQTPKAQLSTFQVTQNATVALLMEDEDTGLKEAYCGGVFVTPKEFVTAHHCAEAEIKNKIIGNLPPALRMLVLMNPEILEIDPEIIMAHEFTYLTYAEMPDVGFQAHYFHGAHAIALDKDNDLALIRIEDQNTPAHGVVKIATSLPQIEDKVVITGHPGGLYFTYSPGTITAIRFAIKIDDEVRYGPFLQVHAGMSSGNSGAGVFNEQGELLGINRFIAHNTYEGFAISGLVVHKFVKDNLASK